MSPVRKRGKSALDYGFKVGIDYGFKIGMGSHAACGKNKKDQRAVNGKNVQPACGFPSHGPLVAWSISDLLDWMSCLYP
jgi:hypothetical protein